MNRARQFTGESTGKFTGQSAAIAIKGYGLATSMGSDADATFSGLLQGKTGTRTISRFDPGGLKTTIAAVFSAPELTGVENTIYSRLYNSAHCVINETLAMAGLKQQHLKQTQLFCALPAIEVDARYSLKLNELLSQHAEGSSFAGIDAHREMLRSHLPDLYLQSKVARLAQQLHQEYDFAGLPMVINTACASGATALKLAVQALRRGDCESAFVLASDGSVTAENIARFSRLGALSTRNENPTLASRPFDVERDGFVMGEGAAAMLLCREDATCIGDSPDRGLVVGVGSATDNFHVTRSNPDGSKIIESMAAALIDAGLEPADIDGINAHGTSTPENDRAEALGIQSLFADRAAELLVTANKSALGHTTHAAGLVEAVISLMSLESQCMPPTLNCQQQDENLPLNVVTVANQTASKAHRLHRILSNSFAFGGQNESIILQRS